MKKLVIALIFLGSSCLLHANEPPAIIKEMKTLMNERLQGYPNTIGVEQSRDEENGYIYYETKQPVSDLAETTLFDKIGTTDRIYMIYYDKLEANANALKSITALKKQYEQELLEMQASGHFRISNYPQVDGVGDEVFEVNDLEGKHILEYHDNKEALTIMFWGKSK